MIKIKYKLYAIEKTIQIGLYKVCEIELLFEYDIKIFVLL